MFATLAYLAYAEPCFNQNYDIFRNLAYSEPWHVENPGIFATLL